MTIQEELENLIKNEVLVEIEDYIDELFEIIASKKEDDDTKEELSQEETTLMMQAVEARSKAYAPYSKFTVGAAILLDNGIVVQGSNQENAAYPSGLCAERVVIFYAGANYPDNKIVKLFISATPSDRDSENPIPPCGSCRQSIAEYEIKQDLPRYNLKTKS